MAVISVDDIKRVAQQREKQFLACLGLYHGFVDVEDNLEQRRYDVKLFDPNGHLLGLLFVRYDQVDKFLEAMNDASN